MLTTLISGWQVKLILLLAVIFGVWTWHRAEVKMAVNEAVSQIEVQQAKESFRLKERSLNTQLELQAKVDKIQKEKDDEISNLKSRVSALSSSLSNRPSRQEPSGVSNNPSNPESTGYVAADRLYRDDAEVLVWFSARTEGLKIALQSCYKQYDEVKETLDKFKRNEAHRSP